MHDDQIPLFDEPSRPLVPGERPWCTDCGCHAPAGTYGPPMRAIVGEPGLWQERDLSRLWFCVAHSRDRWGSRPHQRQIDRRRLRNAALNEAARRGLRGLAKLSEAERLLAAGWQPTGSDRADRPPPAQEPAEGR